MLWLLQRSLQQTSHAWPRLHTGTFCAAIRPLVLPFPANKYCIILSLPPVSTSLPALHCPSPCAIIITHPPMHVFITLPIGMA